MLAVALLTAGWSLASAAQATTRIARDLGPPPLYLAALTAALIGATAALCKCLRGRLGSPQTARWGLSLAVLAWLGCLAVNRRYDPLVAEVALGLAGGTYAWSVLLAASATRWLEPLAGWPQRVLFQLCLAALWIQSMR